MKHLYSLFVTAFVVVIVMVFRVSPWGVLPLDCLQKRGSGFYRFRGFSRGGAAIKIWKRRGDFELGKR